MVIFFNKWTVKCYIKWYEVIYNGIKLYKFAYSCEKLYKVLKNYIKIAKRTKIKKQTNYFAYIDKL